eukprot:scaffold91227_cov27-Tisochrysis_lutea.AAC.2
MLKPPPLCRKKPRAHNGATVSLWRLIASTSTFCSGKRASAGAPPMKDGGIGWLGDQTLYSWMSVNSTGHRRFFHDLPCGWNRQVTSLPSCGLRH